MYQTTAKTDFTKVIGVDVREKPIFNLKIIFNFIIIHYIITIHYNTFFFSGNTINTCLHFKLSVVTSLKEYVLANVNDVVDN